jgi:hypothetical protein
MPHFAEDAVGTPDFINAAQTGAGERLNSEGPGGGADPNRANSGDTAPVGCGSACFAILFTLLMAALVYLIDSLVSRRMPTVMGAICPVAGSWLGGWLGIIWSGGWRRRLLWIPQLFGLVGALAVLFMVLMWLALESHPLPFEVAPITSEDKRQLVRLLREKDPRDIDPGETQQLSLTSDQTNQLLNWALSIGSRERKAKVAFFADAAELNFSIGLPIPRIGVRYLNVTARGQIRVDSGRVRVQPHLLDVGRIAPPNWLVSLIGRAVIAEVEADRFAKPVLAAIERIDIDPSQITVLFGAMRLPDGMVSDVFNRMQPGSDVLPATRLYVQRLLDLGSDLPVGDARFAVYIEEAFKMALERSRDGDPIAENRAAIYALAILLGHRRVQTIVGRAMPPELPASSVRKYTNVSLRGRSDWSRHFWVSAALALISNQASSDAAGLLKEELDAGHAGSGFSFADLLADRAGTTMALAATRNAASARSIQQRLAHGFVVDDFFPPAADLPEDLEDAELVAQYGGVNGEGYNRIVRVIEQRIADCAAYK